MLYDDETFDVTGKIPGFYTIQVAGILIAALAFIFLLLLRRRRKESFKEDVRSLKERVKKLKNRHISGT